MCSKNSEKYVIFGTQPNKVSMPPQLGENQSFSQYFSQTEWSHTYSEIPHSIPIYLFIFCFLESCGVGGTGK